MEHIILDAIRQAEYDPTEMTEQDMQNILETASEEDCLEFINTMAVVGALSPEMKQMIIDKAEL